MKRSLLILYAVACMIAGGPTALLAQEIPAEDKREAGDVLPYRLLYGKPGKTLPGQATCAVWNEGGRLHVRISGGGKALEIAGELRAKPAGILKDVAVTDPGIRIRQPVPWILRFDTRTGSREEEFSVVLAGETRTLRIDLNIDGKPSPEALRIGERAEHPRALPADLAFTGAQASWIERFGFE